MIDIPFMRPKAPPRWRGLFGRAQRVKDEGYLMQVRQLPCLLTGFTMNVHAAHVRYADIERDKRQVGMGEKPDDQWAVPLVQDLHTMLPGAQHNHNERRWWQYFGVDPLRVAQLLYGYRNNTNAMLEVVEAFRPTQPGYKSRIERALRGLPINLEE